MQDQDNMMKHLANADRLWNNENVKTPGKDVQDFTMNYYGPKVQAMEQEKLLAPLSRYATYFKIPS